MNKKVFLWGTNNCAGIIGFAVDECTGNRHFQLDSKGQLPTSCNVGPGNEVVNL